MKRINYLCVVALLLMTVLIFSDCVHVEAASKSGWKISNSQTYYYKSGKRVSGWRTINKQVYYFKKSGTKQTKYSMLIGWQTINGNNFYFKKTGAKGIKGKTLTGWQTLNGKTYYLKKTGANGTKGKVLTGFQKLNGNIYYFKKTGAKGTKGKMLTGWQTLNGKTYYFKKTGSNGTKGKALIGWKTLSGKTFYFYSDGHMAKNTTIDGKKLNKDGFVEDNNTSPTPTPAPTKVPTATPTPSSSTTANYTVEYYLEKESTEDIDVFRASNYTLKETTTQTGTIGNTVTAQSKSYTNYTLRSRNNVSTAVLSKSGTVLKLYYDRTVCTAKIQRYMQNVSGSGYTLTYTDTYSGKWGTELYSSKSYTGFTQTQTPMGYIAKDGSLLLKAYYDRDVCEYKVVLNLQNLDRTGYSAQQPVKYQGLYGQTITSNDVSLSFDTSRYYLDLSVTGTCSSITLKDDSSVLNLYCNRVDQACVLKYDAVKSRKVFDLINEYRVSKGKAAMEWDNNYCLKVAKINAGYNAFHYSYGSDDSVLALHTGTSIGVGGIGIIEADQALEAWKSSPGHNANMLWDSNISGAVAAFTYNDKYGHQWTSIILGVDTWTAQQNAALTDTQTRAYLEEDFGPSRRFPVPLSEWDTYINTPSIT